MKTAPRYTEVSVLPTSGSQLKKEEWNQSEATLVKNLQMFLLFLLCLISPQLQQGTSVNGEVLGSQRTTFVKQLKLGKVTFLLISLCNYLINNTLRKLVCAQFSRSKLPFIS